MFSAGDKVKIVNPCTSHCTICDSYLNKIGTVIEVVGEYSLVSVEGLNTLFFRHSKIESAKDISNNYLNGF